MTTALKARDLLAEAQAAAEAEGIFAPTAEQRKAIRRLRDLAARKRAIETEEAAIKNSLVTGMQAVGAMALAENGKNLVLFVPKSKEEVFFTELDREYPKVAAEYYDAKAAYEALIPLYTYRVPATTAKTFPGVS